MKAAAAAAPTQNPNTVMLLTTPFPF